MKWVGRRESSNIKVSGQSGNTSGKFAIGGIGTIIVVVIGLLLSKNPVELLNQVVQNETNNATDKTQNMVDKESLAYKFTGVVLADT